MSKENKATKKLINTLKRSIDTWSDDNRSMDRTIEVIPDDHIYQLSEEELRELDKGFGRDGGCFETTYTIATNYEVKNYSFPPTCYYLGDEDREAAGQLLGNWMAYTEDVYDELIDLGVEPKDLVYMVRWKRDTD